MRTDMLSALQLPPPAHRLLTRSDNAWDEIWRSLSHLESIYPGFGRWFRGIVEPGLLSGSRRIFVSRSSSGLDGIVIAKRCRAERKLCTVWTAPHARGSRIATSLIAEAIDWMDDPLPLLSVPEERLPEFRGLITGFGFAPTQVLHSYYRFGKAEYVFNGCLRRQPDC